MATSSYITAGANDLKPAILQAGQQLTSENGYFTLNMQTDGTLCVYYWQNADQNSLANRITVWATNTWNNGATPLCLELFGGQAPWAVVVPYPTNPASFLQRVWGFSPGASQYCLSMDNDGCVRMYAGSTPPAWNTGNPNANPPVQPSAQNAFWQSSNGVIAGLMNAPKVAAYPACQEPQYSNNGNPMAAGAPTNFQQLFIQAWRADPSVNSVSLPSSNPAPQPDFIRSLYSNPTNYSPSNINAVLCSSYFPTTAPAGCSAADWAVIQQIESQIETETGNLANLLNFQNNVFKPNVTDLNCALIGGYNNAWNYLNEEVQEINANAVSGTGVLWDILSGICGIGGAVVEPFSVPFAVLGAVIGVVQNYITGGGPIGGDLGGQEGAIYTALNNTVNMVNTQAGDLYASICTDWGKLQIYMALLNLDVLPSQADTDYNTISEQFEISLYQMLLPSIAAIVSMTDDGQTTDTVFAATPKAGLHLGPRGLENNSTGAEIGRASCRERV